MALESAEQGLSLIHIFIILNFLLDTRIFFSFPSILSLKPLKELKKMLDRISLILVVIGAINWGSIGLFKFDIVAWICGGQGAILSRIIYTVVALAGIWCLSLLFRENEVLEVHNGEQ